MLRKDKGRDTGDAETRDAGTRGQTKGSGTRGKVPAEP